MDIICHKCGCTRHGVVSRPQHPWFAVVEGEKTPQSWRNVFKVRCEQCGHEEWIRLRRAANLQR